MPTDRRTFSYLRLADEKVRKGAYADALEAVRLAQSADPGNMYAQAYAERIQDLLGQHSTERVALEWVDQPVSENDPEITDAKTILAILDRVNNHIALSQYEIALQEIRHARNLAPSDEDFRLLEEKLRAAFERQLEEEFSCKERESVLQFLSALIESACASASRGEFEAAFQSITQAALLKPDDETLKECASLVAIARNQWNARDEEEKTASICLAGILESCRKRDAIRHRIYTARTRLLDGEYDDALLEIALALTIDPTHVEVRELEQETWQAKARAAARNEASRCCDGTMRLSRLYLLAAEEFAHSGDFPEALDLVTRMRMLDPSNPDTRKAELRIRQLEVKSKQKPREVLHSDDPYLQVANDQ